MTMYDTAAERLEQGTVDLLHYEEIHPHDPKKIIRFAAVQAAPHPSMASRHRRAQRQALLRYRLLAVCPRVLCVALLALYFYLRLAVFPEGGVNLGGLWIAAYLLAGVSIAAEHLLGGAPGAKKHAHGTQAGNRK